MRRSSFASLAAMVLLAGGGLGGFGAAEPPPGSRDARRKVARERAPSTGRRYPDQSTRQRARAARYENHTNPLTGHVTHGLKAHRFQKA